jgi:leader peptidase (prepilin peptidase)/N-methyltransferase
MLSFIFGATIGSFLNVCIGRIPNGESIIRPPSHCVRCQGAIAFYDNIPLISYLMLRGRCRTCGERFSPRYFLVEFLMGLLTLALYYRFGLGFEFLVGFIFVAAMIVISFIDLDVRIVPDVISLPGIVLGLALSIIGYFLTRGSTTLIPGPASSLIGIIAGGGSLLAKAC